MTSSANPDRPDSFICIGDYSPPHADRFLEALKKADIRFEIECDDGIHGSLSKFGTFGQKAKVRVFVDRDQTEDAGKIHETLFGR